MVIDLPNGGKWDTVKTDNLNTPLVMEFISPILSNDRQNEVFETLDDGENTLQRMVSCDYFDESNQYKLVYSRIYKSASVSNGNQVKSFKFELIKI